EGEEQPDGGSPLRQFADLGEAFEGIQGIERRTLHIGGRVREDADVEDEENEHLADEGDAEDPGGELDIEIGEDGDQRHHEQGQIGPLDVDTSQVVDLEVHEVGEAAA